MPATTPNIALTQWTGINDQFSHSELAANFAAIDAHNHTGAPSKGLQIPTGGLVNLAVTAAKIAPDSVLTTKLLDGNVTTPKLENQAVTAAKVGVLPRTRVHNNVGQTVPNNIASLVLFNAERFDTDNMHDTVTNPARITCKTAGTYFIGTTVQWGVNATGTRQVYLRLNGATIIAADRRAALAIDDVQQTISTIYVLAVNDYIEVVARQSSGVGLDMSSVPQTSPEFYAAFLSN